jgi:hypothetical protein
MAVCVALLGLTVAPARSQGPADSGSAVPIIDTHCHPARGRHGNLPRIASMALGRMDQAGIRFAIMLPPPFPPDPRERYGVRELSSLAREHPDRLAFAAGGESINVLLHATPAQSVTTATVAQLTQQAEAIAKSGAVAIGEIAIEHLSSGRGRHPYESVPADHPLLYALVDAAARLDLPVDVHMEAVPADMPLPRPMGSANPATLPANIAAFERLLEHNLQARIIWAHAGWDNTLERTVPLMRTLLGRHANLYMSIKVQPGGPQRNSPFTPSGDIKPGWLALLHDFPDRFVIGSDQFYDEDDDDRLTAARRLVSRLPAELAAAVGHENARRLYRLQALPAPTAVPR